MILKSEKQTRAWARKFASGLKGGEVLCLGGDLGSGKTAFTKGLAQGLGVKQIITSPTFVLMKVNEGNLNLVHIDAYSLSSGEDLKAIGASDYFSDPNYVTVIEWADKVKDVWPKKRIMIWFEVKGKNQREIIIKQIGQ